MGFDFMAYLVATGARVVHGMDDIPMIPNVCTIRYNAICRCNERMK